MAAEDPEQIDARRLACSLPLVKLAGQVRRGSSGDTFEAFCDMPGFLEDVELWCRRTGHRIVTHLRNATGTTVVVRKR